jgi:hypothetical protein
MLIYFVIMGKFTKFELLFAKNQSIVININLPEKNRKY